MRPVPLSRLCSRCACIAVRTLRIGAQCKTKIFRTTVLIFGMVCCRPSRNGVIPPFLFLPSSACHLTSWYVRSMLAQQAEATWTVVRADPSSSRPQPQVSDQTVQRSSLETGTDSTNVDPGSSAAFTDFPTATADDLATALFVADSNGLSRVFAFDCAVLDADCHQHQRRLPQSFLLTAVQTTVRPAMPVFWSIAPIALPIRIRARSPTQYRSPNTSAKHADYPR